MTIIKRSDLESRLIEAFRAAKTISYEAGRFVKWDAHSGSPESREYRNRQWHAECAEKAARRVAIDERGEMITCPECEGQGEHEEMSGSSRSIEPTWSYSQCDNCDGKGELEALPEDVLGKDYLWYDHTRCEGGDACEYCAELEAQQAAETVESV